MTAIRFADRVAVVTGAGSGIGLASARRFAKEGASVACLDVDASAVEEAAKGIRSFGGVASAHICDVTNGVQIEAVFAQVQRHYSLPITILFANAGIEGPHGFVTDISIEDWNRILEVNLTGPFLCARFAIPSMRNAGGGAIVISGSNSSFVAFPKWAAYTATKGGVLMLTKNLAVDHAPDNIRVNCVCPGATDTSMLDRVRAASSGGEVVKWRGRLSTPDEVASVVTFLASDEASMITGAAIAVDFGGTARNGPTWPSPNYWD